MNAKRAGFSLAEVVVAVGIFAVAMTGVLALLPTLTAQSAESADRMTALRLAGALRTELRRIGGTGFEALAQSVPIMSAPLENGFALVAARDGVRLHAVAYRPPPKPAQIPADNRYFLVEAWRFDRAPWAYEATVPMLALYVRVSWPHAVRGNTAITPQTDRQEVTFALALDR